MYPSIESPYLSFFDSDGLPLDSGYIYIGEPNQNPETAPAPVYWDAEGTQPVAQPIRTLNGYPVRSGTPAMIFSPSVYSISVKDKRNSLIYYAPDAPTNFSGMVSIKAFGARGNGVTDDTNAINSALAYMASRGGGGLYFPKGNYKVSSTLVYTGSNLKIYGDGVNATVFRPTFGDSNLFTFSGPWITLTDFLVDSAATFTAGYLFEFTTTSGNIWMHNVASVTGFNVVGFTGANAAQTYIDKCQFNNFKGDGIVYGTSYGGFGVLSNLNLNNAGDYCVGAAIRCQSGDTFTWSNVQTQCSQSGITVRPQSGGFVRNIFASNVLSDGVGRSFGNPGWHLDATVAGAVEIARVHLSNCWAGALPSHGYQVQGVVGLTMSNCIAVANVGNGIYLTTSPSPNGTIIRGCQITGNSLNAAGLYSGIRIDNNVGLFTITDNMIVPLVTPGVTNTQKYGIEILGTNHDHYVITGNQVWGNVTGNILDEGTGVNKIITNNMMT